MKYLLMAVTFTWSVFALADNRVAGVWVWVGNQCRDSQLSYDSRRSVAIGTPVDGFSFNESVITADGNGNITFSFSGTVVGVEDQVGDTQQGTYTMEGNLMKAGNESGGFSAYLIAGQLVTHDLDGSNSVCNNDGERFVRIFGRVDR